MPDLRSRDAQARHTRGNQCRAPEWVLAVIIAAALGFPEGFTRPAAWVWGSGGILLITALVRWRTGQTQGR